jgi:E3 ubiquitin-protein ligase HUWE1
VRLTPAKLYLLAHVQRIAVVKLFHTRRPPDAPTKQRILDASALIADVILKHLAPKEYGMHFLCEYDLQVTFFNVEIDDKLSLYTYYTVMVGLLSALLVDGKYRFISH